MCFLIFPKEAMHQHLWIFLGRPVFTSLKCFCNFLFQQTTSLPRAKHPGHTHKNTWSVSYTIQKSCSNTSPLSPSPCSWPAGRAHLGSTPPSPTSHCYCWHSCLLLLDRVGKLCAGRGWHFRPCAESSGICTIMVFNPGRDQSGQLAWPVFYRPEKFIKISKEQTRQPSMWKYVGRESGSWAVNSKFGVLWNAAGSRETHCAHQHFFYLFVGGWRIFVCKPRSLSNN